MKGVSKAIVNATKEWVWSEKVRLSHSYQLIDVNGLMVHENSQKFDTSFTAILQLLMEIKHGSS